MAAAVESEMPVRVQRKRVRGWRKPLDAINVSRPSRWGNPFKVGEDGTAKEVVELYQRWIDPAITVALTNWRNSLYDLWEGDKTKPSPYFGVGLVWAGELEKLRGKNLMCFCPLTQPCHADILLKLANDEQPAPAESVEV